MGNAKSRTLTDTSLELTQPNSVWRQAPTPSRVHFSADVKDESLCIPGPKPNFIGYRQKIRRNPVTGQREAYMTKTPLLPMATYLNGYESNDNVKYGCNPGQYIKYENGHYCCVDSSNKATPQEMLNFINMTLESFFDNIGFSSSPNAYAREKYSNSVKELDFLLHCRADIMSKTPGLVDNLEVPPDVDISGNETPITLDEWVRRFKIRDMALVDSLEGQPDSERETLDSMRGEFKPDGTPLYTRKRTGQTKFGGRLNKKTQNRRKKTKTTVKHRQKGKK